MRDIKNLTASVLASSSFVKDGTNLSLSFLLADCIQQCIQCITWEFFKYRLCCRRLRHIVNISMLSRARICKRLRAQESISKNRFREPRQSCRIDPWNQFLGSLNIYKIYFFISQINLKDTVYSNQISRNILCNIQYT